MFTFSGKELTFIFIVVLVGLLLGVIKPSDAKARICYQCKGSGWVEGSCDVKPHAEVDCITGRCVREMLKDLKGSFLLEKSCAPEGDDRYEHRGCLEGNFEDITETESTTTTERCVCDDKDLCNEEDSISDLNDSTRERTGEDGGEGTEGGGNKNGGSSVVFPLTGYSVVIFLLGVILSAYRNLCNG